MIRAFLALPVPDDIRLRLSALQHRLPLPRPVPLENFHITLVFLDKQPEPLLEDLHHAIETMRLAAPLLRLDGLGSFGGNEPDAVHACVAPDARMSALHTKLSRAAREAGIPVKARKFVPHITLGRLRKHEVGPETLARAIGALGEVTSQPWLAETLVLYRSTLRADGPVYDPLAEYRLGG